MLYIKAKDEQSKLVERDKITFYYNTKKTIAKEHYRKINENARSKGDELHKRRAKKEEKRKKGKTIYGR